MPAALQYFKALSDQTRLRLIQVLQRFELSVNELVQLLGMGQSRVSRHLKILADASLLHWRRDGLWVFYRAAGDGAGKDFLSAVTPFTAEDAIMRADLDAAARIIAERALKTRRFFDAVAEDWDVLNREILEDFDPAEAVRAALPEKCGTAVDLGCGTGMVLERIQFHAREVIGVDGSPHMLEMARRRLAASAQGKDPPAAVSLRIGELDHLPLRDGEADFACINLVLHHLSDPQTALREIRRILKKRGLLFISDFERHDDEWMRKEYGDRWLGFDADVLRAMLEKAGFAPRAATRRTVGRGLVLLLVPAEAA